MRAQEGREGGWGLGLRTCCYPEAEGQRWCNVRMLPLGAPVYRWTRPCLPWPMFARLQVHLQGIYSMWVNAAANPHTHRCSGSEISAWGCRCCS